MHAVLLLVPDLGCTGHAKQVSLIAPRLPGAEVYSLGGPGLFAGSLPRHAARVRGRAGRSLWDLDEWLSLRTAVRDVRAGFSRRFDPGLVHVFGVAALRTLRGAAVGMRLPPVVLALTGRERLTWFDRRCMRIVGRVVVPHQHAAEALSRQGIPAGRISVIPPAVDTLGPTEGRIENPSYGGGPLIVTVGSMPDRLRLLPAVWMFEFVRYPHADAHLLVIGDGPGRAALEDTARGLAPEGSRIHFLGERPDARDLLARADVVVVLHRWGGANVALEAMAAGRAVVAADTPDLAALIRDGETGRLVTAGDAAAAAKAVHQLLLDPEECRRLGGAAGAHVLRHHQTETVVQMLETVYREEFTSTRPGMATE